MLKTMAGDALQLSHITLGDEILANIMNWDKSLDQRICLIHGDYRFGNVLFRPFGETIVVDWQTIHWANPGCDMAHFLMNSTSPEQRTLWQDELSEHYIQALANNGVVAYTKAEWEFDFRVGMLFEVLMVMTTVFGVGADKLNDEVKRPLWMPCKM